LTAQSSIRIRGVDIDDFFSCSLGVVMLWKSLFVLLWVQSRLVGVLVVEKDMLIVQSKYHFYICFFSNVCLLLFTNV
jgi:hypothetical protein